MFRGRIKLRVCDESCPGSALGVPSTAACAAACYSRLDGGTHVLTVSAAVKTRPQSREAVAHSRYPRLAGGLSTRGLRHGRPHSCLLLQDLRAALAPRCVAVSVATALRRRACSLAHASMSHAARRALATCDPHACAGTEFFHRRRATTTTRCRASPSTPTTRGRRRRRRARRGYRRFAASTCSAAVPTVWWPRRPVSALDGRRWLPVAHVGRHQCCGWPGSHFGRRWCPLGCLTRAVPERTLGVCNGRNGRV